ncbi:MAG: uroporphyrinogen decarboxylase family protein [bacterium]
MTSRERVLKTLQAEPADRVPLNVFAGWNPGPRERVEKKYGDVDGFYDKFHIDIVTGVLPRFPFGRPEKHSKPRNLDEYCQMQPVDPTASSFLDQPCDGDLFPSVREALDYKQKNKAVFVHVWGVFELSQFLFESNGQPGIEEALINMAAEKEKMLKLYDKLAEWSAAAAENAIRAGADVLELSDDWGQQQTMLFSPKLWWELIFPATKIIVDIAQKHGVPVILHSDGDITLVLDGVRKLKIQGLHPVQESAGMSFSKTREILGKEVCIMGGLDIVTALPRMSEEEVRAEVKRTFRVLKNSGPFIFAGSHMFQQDAPLDVIEAAYEAAYELAVY